MLIDSHCHLDAAEFDADQAQQISLAKQVGVEWIVVPAVSEQNFDTVIQLASQHHACCYALGWHPMYVNDAKDNAITQLQQYVEQHIRDKKLVAIGEIGLDLFITKNNVAKQTYLFTEQLKIAQKFDLPVILHVRKAVDEVLKYLRRYPVRGGIAHAFNGSPQQAQLFTEMGFKLGFGGAMTFLRASKIRALAKTLALEHIVLETDAPDIPPAWIGHDGRNSPQQLDKIAEVLAEIRGITKLEVMRQTTINTCNALPKLADLCTPL